MVLMWTGNEFQAARPATVNDLSANRVLVRRTAKFQRVDDRRRWSLQRLHRSVRYSGAVSWKTSNIKMHNYNCTLHAWQPVATGSQCNRRSNGVTWLKQVLHIGLPDEQRYSEFAEAVDERPRCSSQTVRCNRWIGVILYDSK